MTNTWAAVTSAPAIMGQPGSALILDFAAGVGPAPQWTTFDSVLLNQTAQWYFDLSTPLTAQRFYCTWYANGLGQAPSLNLHLVPAITLTGDIGHSVRVDYINRFGPIDAWVTLDMVTLTNTSQLYFDVSAPRPAAPPLPPRPVTLNALSQFQKSAGIGPPINHNTK